MKKAIFLDRDGVINRKRVDYVKTIDEFVMIDGIERAIRMLKNNGYLIIVITNQSAVNRGLLTEEGLNDIHNHMLKELKKNGAKIDGVYYCPHRPEENCECRKPKPGMLIKAINDFSISAQDSFFVGDSESDIRAAKGAGVCGIQIDKNQGLLEIAKTICDS